MAGRYLRKKKNIGLNITSMMDMFTIMLVFMLKNFAAEGSILTNADNLVLPYSASKESPKDVSVSLNCTNDWVIIDNEAVIPTRQIRKQKVVEVKAIRDRLRKKMEQEENMVRIGALTRVRGEIVVQLDKNIDFDIVYKIMASSGAAGYSRIRLAVMSRETD